MTPTTTLLDPHAVTAELDALVEGWQAGDADFARLSALLARLRACPEGGADGAGWMALRMDDGAALTVYAFRASDADIGVRGAWEGDMLAGAWLRRGGEIWGVQGNQRWTRRYADVQEDDPGASIALTDLLDDVIDNVRGRVNADARAEIDEARARRTL